MVGGGLDFDGDYGRHYAETIRTSIPPYDTLQEIGAAALAAFAPVDGALLVQAVCIRLWLSRRPPA